MIMSGLGHLIGAEVRKLFREPSRLKELFRRRRWRQFAGLLTFQVRTGNRWRATSQGPAFQQRVYPGYDDYLEHQQAKVQHLDLSRHEIEYRKQLGERLTKTHCLKKGASVLCLGARLGAEVRAFHDQGCFAVGVDLNPGERNPCVVYGDFHNLQFPDESVDLVFTNSLDHVFEADRFIREIRRVLEPTGILILEAVRGRAEGVAPDAYASYWWDSVDDVIALFQTNGFKLFHRSPFTEPWQGEQLCFEKRPLAKSASPQGPG